MTQNAKTGRGTIRRRRERPGVLVALAVNSMLASAGCGNDSTSPVAPTPAPTAATPMPTPEPEPVYFTDFESGGDVEWSGGGSIEGTQGYSGVATFQSLFLRNDTGRAVPHEPQTPTVLTLANLPPHTGLRLTFLFAAIDSWDGDTPGPNGPDFFNVRLDGVLVYHAAFSHYDLASNPVPPLVFHEHLGFHPDGWDAAFALTVDASHAGSDARIEFFANGAGWQGDLDESWAVDDVRVFAE
jgi:hypothetical protein